MIPKHFGSYKAPCNYKQKLFTHKISAIGLARKLLSHITNTSRGIGRFGAAFRKGEGIAGLDIATIHSMAMLFKDLNTDTLTESYLEALEVVREHEGNDWKEVNGILEKGESNGKN